jgi:hypothetical protein
MSGPVSAGSLGLHRGCGPPPDAESVPRVATRPPRGAPQRRSQARVRIPEGPPSRPLHWTSHATYAGSNPVSPALWGSGRADQALVFPTSISFPVHNSDVTQSSADKERGLQFSLIRKTPPASPLASPREAPSRRPQAQRGSTPRSASGALTPNVPTSKKLNWQSFGLPSR